MCINKYEGVSKNIKVYEAIRWSMKECEVL